VPRLQGGSIVQEDPAALVRVTLYVQLLQLTETPVGPSTLTLVAGGSTVVNQHKLLILKEIALIRAELIKFAP
jgi:hypothetical protein